MIRFRCDVKRDSPANDAECYSPSSIDEVVCAWLDQSVTVIDACDDVADRQSCRRHLFGEPYAQLPKIDLTSYFYIRQPDERQSPTTMGTVPLTSTSPPRNSKLETSARRPDYQRSRSPTISGLRDFV